MTVARTWDRAFFLSESEPAEAKLSRLQTDEVLARWREKCGFSTGDTELFSGLLLSQNLQPLDLASRLEGRRMWAWSDEETPLPDLGVPDGAAPAWQKTLWRIFSAWEVNSSAASGLEAFTFDSAVRAFVGYAWLEIRERLVPLPTHLVDWDSVTRDLQAHLAGKILALCDRVLVLELNVARLESRLQGVTPEERFRFYVDCLLQEKTEWLKLLNEYQVLARLIAVTLQNAVAEIEELFTRLLGDREILRREWFQNVPAPLLKSLQGGLSDPHRGGKGVWILSFAAFEATVKIVYKPKPLDVDKCFQDFLAWCDERLSADELPSDAWLRLRRKNSEFPRFQILKIVVREGYGWTEFVENIPCRSRRDVSDFYWREGALLALLHALGAIDLHWSNVIARGAHPALIDLETLFHAPWQMSSAVTANEAAEQRLSASVMKVGLLPSFVWGAGGVPGVNISGLGGAEAQTTPLPIADWDNTFTDEMRLVNRCKEMERPGNLPLLDGQAVSAADDVREVADGFEVLYRFLKEQKSEVLADEGPLAAFRDVEIRRVLRPTVVYASFLRDLTHPDQLRDALNAEAALNGLWLLSRDNAHQKKFIASEKDSLAAGDVPVFTAKSCERDVRDDRGKFFPDVLPQSGWDFVCNRIAALSADDLAWQVRILNQSLTSLTSGHEIGTVTTAISQKNVSAPDQISPRVLTDLSMDLGERLLREAIPGPDGVTWLGVNYASVGIWHLAPAGSGLYDGTAGISLFLAYLGKATGEKRFLQTAESALRVTERGSYSLGGFSGSSSRLYALHHMHRLTGDAFWSLEIAKELPRLRAEIGKDHFFDLVSGVAGVAAILLTLDSEEAFDMALLCGRHLLQNTAKQRKGLAWLRAGVQRPLLGFSHGNAGIAWVLASLADALAKRSDDEAFAAALRETAREALVFERDHFDAATANWPDLRKDNAKVFAPHAQMTAWCHGAAGIALARDLMEPHFGDAMMDEEISIGVGTILSDGLGSNHSLCHGDLGNLMILSRIVERRPRVEWRLALHSHLSRVVGEMRGRGPACGLPTRTETPGLLCGIAGIGYGLLYLADPKVVPLVLGLEAP